MKGLSKSRIIAWKQCPKQLWLQVHKPSLIVQSEATKRNFQVGNAVGEAARKVYPAGELIEHVYDLKAALAATQAALSKKSNVPLFEAAFQHEGVLIRADVLLPEKNGYRMVEVKSSTGLKDYHLNDCAAQTWVVKQNGVLLTSVELAHIDTSFIYQGDDDYRGLFRHVVLDEQIEPLLEQVPKWVEGARTTLCGDEPAIEPGEQCTAPFECQFYAYCTRNMAQATAPEFPLEVFYRMQTGKKEELRAQGYEDALTVPETQLNETQRWIQRVSRAGKAELKPAAQQELAALPYPRYYLDFETIALAVPRWEGTRPYSTQVPFQWSCHIEDEPGKLRHAMFLDTSGGDPRRAFAESMVKILGQDGPVIVYNQSFEKSRIKELAEYCVDLADDLLAINERVVDLLPIAQANYYHPDMKGSWSIKAVLPTIAPDLTYDNLEVGNGEDAQVAYAELLDSNTSNEQRKKLIEGLLAYCERDTLAMVRIAWFFQRGGNMDGVQFPEPEEKYLMTRSRATIEVVGDVVTQEDMGRADQAALDASANNDGIVIEKKRLCFYLDKERQSHAPLGKHSKELTSVWEIERLTPSRRPTAFSSEVINSLVNKIKDKGWDKDLPTLYKWSLRDQLINLKKVCEEMPKLHTKWLDDLCDTPADSENNEPTFAMTLELREQIPAMLKASNADEMGEIDAVKNIKIWIVKDWGGIQLRHEQSEDRLSDCIKQAVIQDASVVKQHARNKSGKKEFSLERIASWSKYLAFKFPQRCAIYDARVIFSLNWLLLEIKNAASEQKKSKIGDEGEFKFFPFLEGQNSVMGLLNYDIHLLLSHYHEDVLLKALDDDIKNRNKKGGKSRLRSSLEKGLFIRDQEAYSEYCDLLNVLAETIYPDKDGVADTHRLTKIEMILFSIADKAIATEVMNSFTGKISASHS
ncbi:MAG: DUF2779 domain-containing protein [Gallionella sp.]|nr:DUF2779 domain-containing protein [Gallionella sp.]